jgi:hypothetical protein
MLIGCHPASDIQLNSGTGSLIQTVPSLLQKVSDASALIKNSFHTLVKDASDRTAHISQGAEKIIEGKEQIEKGVRGE